MNTTTDEIKHHPRDFPAGWIGVGLEGTLVESAPAFDPEYIGVAVPAMLERVRKWLSAGKTVKIFTARAGTPEGIKQVRVWLASIGLEKVGVTDRKDFGMTELWDCRAIGVIKNKGIPQEAVPAMHLKNVLGAVGTTLASSDDYGKSAQSAVSKIAGVLKRYDDALGLIDGAHDALKRCDPDTIREAFPDLASDLDRAKRTFDRLYTAIKGRK